MAWRPHRYLIGGELDNTQPRKVTGWMYFHGLPKRVTLDLEGDFHRDIRGASIQSRGYAKQKTNARDAAAYMESFSHHQTGNVGNMTTGLPPFDMEEKLEKISPTESMGNTAIGMRVKKLMGRGLSTINKWGREDSGRIGR